MKYMTKIKRLMENANLTFWKPYYFLNGRDGKFSHIEKRNIIKVMEYLIRDNVFEKGSYIMTTWEDTNCFTLKVLSKNHEDLCYVNLAGDEDSPEYQEDCRKYGPHWGPIKHVLKNEEVWDIGDPDGFHSCLGNGDYAEGRAEGYTATLLV